MPQKSTPNRFTVHGEIAYIYLCNRKGNEVARAKIDTSDLQRVLAAGRWAPGWNKLARAYYPNAHGGRIYLHRFISDAPHGMDVDHQNHDTLDCRLSNLLVCPHAVNMQNRIERAVLPKSGCRNVYWEPSCNQWRVRFMVNKRTVNVGYFRDLDEAIAVANTERLRYLPNARTT